MNSNNIQMTKIPEIAMSEVILPTQATDIIHSGTQIRPNIISAAEYITIIMDPSTISPYRDNATEHCLNESIHGNTTHAGVTVMDYACITIEEDFQVMLSHQIFLCASISFIVIGLIGNSLSTLVFSSKGMRSVSSNFYLLVLAISDSAYLVSVFLTKGFDNIKMYVLH